MTVARAKQRTATNRPTDRAAAAATPEKPLNLSDSAFLSNELRVLHRLYLFCAPVVGCVRCCISLCLHVCLLPAVSLSICILYHEF